MSRFPFPRVAVLIFFLLASGAILTACASVVRREQPAQSDWLGLPSGGILGQTFVSRYDGLQAVRLNLRSPGNSSGRLTLRLYPAPGSPQTLREASAEVIPQAGTVKAVFQFDPLPDSSQTDYYLEVSFDGGGTLEAAAANGDAYLQGAAYQDGAPIDQQLTFSLQFQSTLLALGLTGELVRWSGWLLAAVFLLVLPGWAMLDWLWQGWRGLDWLARLALAGPVGLALYGVLFLWADQLHLHPGLFFAWLPPLGSAGLLVWRHRRDWRGNADGAPPEASERHSQIENRLFHLAAISLIAVMAGVRFWAIRNLEVPLWGDSVQHDAITRLILVNGGLFSSWEPVAPYQSLTVHYGFSAAAALFGWLLNLPAQQAVLVCGQVLNLMAVLALYPLACLVAGGRQRAGLAVLAVAGLLLPIPAVYVNWGRYAQLAGQTILPVLIWMTLRLSEQEPTTRRGYGQAVLAGITLAGMSLCYYRAPIFYALYMLAWGLVWLLDARHWNWRAMRGQVIVLAVIAGAGILAMIAWVPQIMGSSLSNAVAGGVIHAAPVAQYLADLQIWRTSGVYVPAGYSILAGLGAAWGLWRRNGLAVSFFLWVLLLVGFTFGGLIHLPGANMIQNFTVIILVYIPVGVLCGYLFAEAVGVLSKINPSLAPLLGGGMLLLALAWGARGQARIADPATYALFTRPDGRAMIWIQEKVNDEARFLVEGFTIYEGTTSVGADGGWWIPLLAGRQNTMPPQYALFNERSSQSGYSDQVTALVALLETQPVTSPASIDELCAQGVTHVYVGQRQGMVGAGARQLFSVEALLSSPAYVPVYHQDRVRIFALDPAACQVMK